MLRVPVYGKFFFKYNFVGRRKNEPEGTQDGDDIFPRARARISRRRVGDFFSFLKKKKKKSTTLHRVEAERCEDLGTRRLPTGEESRYTKNERGPQVLEVKFTLGFPQMRSKDASFTKFFFCADAFLVSDRTRVARSN